MSEASAVAEANALGITVTTPPHVSQVVTTMSPKAPTVGTLQTLPACEPDDYADTALLDRTDLRCWPRHCGVGPTPGWH